MSAAKPAEPLTDLPPVEVDERHQSDVEGFIGRNREALNASIRRSREEMTRGVQSKRTIDDVIKDGRSKSGRA